jgi:hypothetical protein
MKNLTAKQQATYEKMSTTEPVCAYDVGASVATMRALVKKGAAKEITKGAILGACFSPRTAFEFLALPKQ